jgi:hypothetical protein
MALVKQEKETILTVFDQIQPKKFPKNLSKLETFAK